MTGTELVAKLRRVRPSMAVLFMSGYDRELIDGRRVESIAGFLPKPFDPRALLNRIDALLRLGGAGEQSASGCGD